MTYADLTQILQRRIDAGLRAGRVASASLKQPQRPDLEVYVAALEKAVAEAEVRSERWRQEADAAVKRVASLEANVTALQEAITEAEAIAEQRRQEVKVAAKRADPGRTLRDDVRARRNVQMDRRTAAGSDKIQFSLSALTSERRVTTNVCAAMVSEAPVTRHK